MTTLQGLLKGSFPEEVLEERIYSEGGSSSSSDAGLSDVVKELCSAYRIRPLMKLDTDCDGALVRLVGETKARTF